ncbi:hypothetical protein KA005_08825 [bacterium]|nr:hypothetical protein [bacterium]
MTRWSKDDLAEYMERRQHWNTEPLEHRGLTFSKEDIADKGPESKLRGKIIKHAKEHAIPCLCFPQTEKVRNFLPPGWPD